MIPTMICILVLLSAVRRWLEPRTETGTEPENEPAGEEVTTR